jgi:uncharacterized protein with FMN-binding domain
MSAPAGGPKKKAAANKRAAPRRARAADATKPDAYWPPTVVARPEPMAAPFLASDRSRFRLPAPRAIAAIAGTVAALAFTLDYKATPLPPVATIAAAPSTTSPPRRAAAGTAALGGATNAQGPGTIGAPATSASTAARAPTAPATTQPPVRPTSTLPPATTTTAGTRQYTGADVPTQYGDVQVEATMNGTELSDVTALKMPSDRARSQQISQDAGPKLRQEALDCQCANVDTVSGATYTSEGYRESLQSALDQARA